MRTHRRRLTLCWLAGCAAVSWTLSPNEGWSQPAIDPWNRQRDAMVDQLQAEGDVRNERVLGALRQTPRHLFVPRHLRAQAYFDMALPIGDQQTISSPFIVAFMTECLDPQPSDRVLEIGTGSGYQAAVLSPLVDHVYSIEIVESLARKAIRTLQQVKISNVTVKIGDGFQGWAEHAPFDKIIVTCSPEKVPRPLVDQLKEGGRLVIPVGQRYQQTMYLFHKKDGRLVTESLRPTLFVPMTGRAEAERNVQPDPQRPRILNGAFEENADASEFVVGWYYQRQAKLVAADDAPQGHQYLRFENTTPGRDAHLMQGLAVDGRHVQSLKISCWVRTRGIDPTLSGVEGPRITISFYDKDRRELGLRWLGPWRDYEAWQPVQKEVAVPGAAREMILRLGLFGATGSADFDDVQLAPLP